jgi:hypothetical protein
MQSLAATVKSTATHNPVCNKTVSRVVSRRLPAVINDRAIMTRSETPAAYLSFEGLLDEFRETCNPGQVEQNAKLFIVIE